MITRFACGCRYDEGIRTIVAKCTDDPDRPAIGERGRIACVRGRWSRFDLTMEDVAVATDFGSVVEYLKSQSQHYKARVVRILGDHLVRQLGGW